MAPLSHEAGGMGGGVSCSCAHPPRLASAMLQKINGQICQEDIKEDNERPFLANIFFRQTLTLRAYGGGGGFLHRTGQGYLALRGTGAPVPHMARALVWFSRAISFTERTAFPATATAYDKSRWTLPGGGAYGESVSPPKAPGTKNDRCTHANRGRFLPAQGDTEAPRAPMRCRLLALSKLVLGSSASCRETRDTWWLTVCPHCVAWLQLGSLAEPFRGCEPNRGASFPFPPF